ncbi:MAG: SurA N-terminal domain-containing protein, partial [Chitinophagaceae bacterium]
GIAPFGWQPSFGCCHSVHAQGLRLPGSAVVPSEPVTGTQRSADYIVAVVNSEPITNHQVSTRRMQRLARQIAQSQQVLPDPRALIAAQALERLINERAQLQLARETGIRIDDAAVDDAETQRRTAEPAGSVRDAQALWPPYGHRPANVPQLSCATSSRWYVCASVISTRRCV